MFFPEQQVRVFVYGHPVDMRRSFDGLYALVQNSMQQIPLSGNLFAFINRRATQIKVLYFDRTGLCIWAKRLEQGRLISQPSGARLARDSDGAQKLVVQLDRAGRQAGRYCAKPAGDVPPA